jgi:uncharacterized protein
MPHYFVKLIPPRPTFVQDMSPEEGRLMGEHGKAMRTHFDAGRLLIYGPVMAPGSSFGMAVFDAAEESEVHRLMDADPTIVAKLNTYEVYPMRVGAARGL